MVTNTIYLAVVSAFISSSIALRVTSGVTNPTRRAAVDGSNWMHNNMNILGGRTLKQICIPGSHDAGMSEYKPGTAFAHPCNVLTQSLPIKGQLANGVRYFDVRPVIGNGGRFMTGHYSKIPGGSWQGGNGQSMESILGDINEFSRAHKEVVIVMLSHTLNTEVGNKNYRPFNQQEWDRLLRLLDGTQNLYVTDGRVYLPSLTLNQLTNNGNRGAVIYIVNEPVNLGARLGKGFFASANIRLYDEYSNTNNLDNMARDQINKMKQQSKNNYFLLSWTLTQGPKEVTLCLTKLSKSIKELADQTHGHLQTLLPVINQSAFPNILYLDNIVSTDVASTAMDINNKIRW